jgi:hypothetical protein
VKGCEGVKDHKIQMEGDEINETERLPPAADSVRRDDRAEEDEKD